MACPAARSAFTICTFWLAHNLIALADLGRARPSGVDTATGKVHDSSIRATATLTPALPKTGLRTKAARNMIAELYVGDIGVAPELYGRPGFGIDVGPIFTESEVIRLW